MPSSKHIRDDAHNAKRITKYGRDEIKVAIRTQRVTDFLRPNQSEGQFPRMLWPSGHLIKHMAT